MLIPSFILLLASLFMVKASIQISGQNTPRSESSELSDGEIDRLLGLSETRSAIQSNILHDIFAEKERFFQWINVGLLTPVSGLAIYHLSTTSDPMTPQFDAAFYWTGLTTFTLAILSDILEMIYVSRKPSYDKRQIFCAGTGCLVKGIGLVAAFVGLVLHYFLDDDNPTMVVGLLILCGMSLFVAFAKFVISFE